MENRLVHILCCFVLCIAVSHAAFAQSTRRHIPLHYQIDGLNEPALKKNVDLTIQNFRSRLHVPITQTDIAHFCVKAPKLIHEALAPYGYFRSTTTCTATQSKNGWMIYLNVNKGPPIPITAIHLQILGAGAYDKKFIDWQKNFPLKVGEALNTQKYEDAKTKLYNIKTKHGYFKAKMVESKIEVNLITYHASITIIFDTGPRFRFGKTDYNKTPFHEKFLNKFLTYHEGEYYDAKKLEETQTGMVSGGFFNQVLIKPIPANAVDDMVPIQINLIPRKSREYTFGLGYGTDTGARATANITLRQFGGQGNRFQTIMRASQTNSSFLMKYLIPGFNPATDLFTILAGASTMQQTTGNGRNVTAGLQYSMAQTNWKETYSLAYLAEHYDFTNLPYTSTALVYPSINVKYIRTDNPSHIRKGVSVQLMLNGASKNILSQTSFTQEVLHFHSLYTVRKTHTRFLLRSDMGHTSISNLYSLPLSLQLFAGGANSVRGYSYNSISPGGGRNLLVGSFEMQQRLFGAIYGAGFFDAGAVGNQSFLQQFNLGAGPGLAWISTIGTIELTYAKALTLRGQPWTIQFTMGSTL